MKYFIRTIFLCRFSCRADLNTEHTVVWRKWRWSIWGWIIPKHYIFWFSLKKQNLIILCYVLHLEENGDELFGVWFSPKHHLLVFIKKAKFDHTLLCFASGGKWRWTIWGLIILLVLIKKAKFDHTLPCFASGRKWRWTIWGLLIPNLLKNQNSIILCYTYKTETNYLGMNYSQKIASSDIH